MRLPIRRRPFLTSAEADADDFFGTNPQRFQIMCELVGTTVQFSIGELLVFKDHGDGVRSFLNLSFEQLMGAPVLGVIGLGVVPLDQELMFSTSATKGSSLIA